MGLLQTGMSTGMSDYRFMDYEIVLVGDDLLISD